MDGRIVIRAFRERGGENGMSELVRVTDVTKVYQGGITVALNGVSVSIEQGEFTAIMGPSGSGKSTMLNLVAGVDRPTSGTVVVGGTDLGKLGEAGLARFRRDHIGFVFQFFYLLPNLTALENVLIPAQLKGNSPNGRARELMERLGITEVANRYPGRLGGGQQQSVAIARALINQPTLLLADEPTGALDTRSGEQVMELLGELHRDGQTVLLVTHETHYPYQLAFDAQKGAHLKVAFDGRIEPGTIAGTPALIGATTSGGPYRATDVQFQSAGHKYVVTAVGRDNPGGDVGQLRIAAGHWPSSATEIALTRSFADLNHISIGQRLKVVSVPQEPVLTVVAEVVDIDELRADVGGVQHAWVLSPAIAPLIAKDASVYLMHYRFASDPTSAQLQAHMDTLRASLPPDSVTSSVNYIFVRTVFHISTQILTGVLVAFSLFALAATAAIVANLVTGIVISAYREIGIMKAVGFTPLQVVGVFVLQILAPAAAACLLGIPAGAILSQPLLASNSQALGLSYQATFSPLLDLIALAGALLIVTIAAVIPAFRAGRLKPAAVIANASAPRGHSGRWLRRLASRARLPRPMVLGLGDAAARPGRAILTLLAIVLGVATVVVALGEARSFNKIYTYEGHIGQVDVVVTKSPALADAQATQLINS